MLFFKGGFYSNFEEKQKAQISDLVRIAFTECDGSIRSGSHGINNDQTFKYKINSNFIGG